ncbi:Uncharacterised protein [Yersinia frederiksenii]|uniref:Uncharacterized protein n=2 Tax=Yersinia frederiksenii TaxID=29484 RepID=A0A380PPA4_YERFR|nr:putative membrane protein [Yersinia frederiksenii ATCC 33641]CNC36278.1 Uncharacterised protein [Yersinia frederiksenii]SUP75390.1 Uncharacterised protein [Yersinia frederiksenii]
MFCYIYLRQFDVTMLQMLCSINVYVLAIWQIFVLIKS